MSISPLPPPTLEWNYGARKIKILYCAETAGSMLSKIHITLKKHLNKSCSELNFVQKSQGAYMSIPPPQWCYGARVRI